MSDIEKNTENKEPLKNDELKQVNGGYINNIYTVCPKCGHSQYDSFYKKCGRCGYRG